MCTNSEEFDSLHRADTFGQPCAGCPKNNCIFKNSAALFQKIEYSLGGAACFLDKILLKKRTLDSELDYTKMFINIKDSKCP